MIDCFFVLGATQQVRSGSLSLPPTRASHFLPSDPARARRDAQPKARSRRRRRPESGCKANQPTVLGMFFQYTSEPLPQSADISPPATGNADTCEPLALSLFHSKHTKIEHGWGQGRPDSKAGVHMLHACARPKSQQNCNNPKPILGED